MPCFTTPWPLASINSVYLFLSSASSFPRPGDIPASDQAKLLAAFNGGFKAVHGGYGMMVDGITLLPPKDGIATLAIYRDGSVRLGAWGRGITFTLDLVAFRQNCPLLLDAGQINPSVNDGSRKEWGYTVQNLDTTWRSGLGISRDGRFLIYAAGNSLTVESLGRALQEGGPITPCNWTLTAFTPALSPTRLLMRPIRNIQSIRHGGSARERCCVHVGQRAR